MKICDDDKYLIATIDEQVKLLLEKGTLEITIIETLFDFIPQVLCLVKGGDEGSLTHKSLYRFQINATALMKQPVL